MSETRDGGGLWTLAGDSPERIGDAPRTIVLVPSEAVLLLAVDLPLPTPRQRLAALPFAIEDRLAEPLDDLHIAIGVQVAPGRYLAGAVRRDRMRQWIERLAEAGLDRYALVPDALALPVPAPESWALRMAGSRALVRTPDGAGFAMEANLLTLAWEAAGRPALLVQGAPPPAGAPPHTLHPAALYPVFGPGPPALDLRQGAFAPRSRPAALAVRRLALAVALGAVAHTAIAGTDVLTLGSIADDRREAALVALRRLAPAIPSDADLVAELERLAPADPGARQGRFFPLLVRTSQALGPFSSSLATRALGYAAADQAISLDLEASDLATLQRAQAALASAGLEPQGGAASAESGRADGRITVRQARGGAP